MLQMAKWPWEIALSWGHNASFDRWPAEPTLFLFFFLIEVYIVEFSWVVSIAT